jgi:hypothetical protein
MRGFVRETWGGRAHRGRRLAGRRAAWELLLLAPPVLFWSLVFMALAGVRPLRGVVEAMSDAGTLAFIVACPLVALLLGVAGVRRAGGGGGRGRGARYRPPVVRAGGRRGALHLRAGGVTLE